MSGDVTIQALKRQTWLPDRDSTENGLLIAGQEYDDVYFVGGEISNVDLVDVTIDGNPPGTVTSVGLSGGTTGLTASGSPVTTSGTITLGGTLAVANGGTGQATANAALNALLPTQTGNANKVLTTDGSNTSWQNNGNGTVTSVSVVSANGLAGSVATASTTPAITLSTSVTGILKGNGTAISAASAGTDYQAAGNYITALTGDVAATGPGSVSATIQNSAVTNAKMANMNDLTVKGNVSGGAAAPSDLTSTQLTTIVNNFVGDSGSGGTKGLVPAPASGDAAANKFLKASGAWATVTTSPFSKSFTSSNQTITNAGTLTLAHSMGTMPTLIQPRIICTTAELGYSINDELIINPCINTTSSAAGLSIVPDSTNINIKFASGGIEIIRKDTGSTAVITNADWALIIRAWA